MKNRVRPAFFNIVAAVVLTTFAGCESFVRGGGSRTLSSGSAKVEAVYGFGDQEKLAFVIFTPAGTSGMSATAGSSWTGEIKTTDGIDVRYEASEESISLNDKDFKFSDGRVFVATGNETTQLSQLDLPIEDSQYDAELKRLAESPEVQNLISAE